MKVLHNKLLSILFVLGIFISGCVQQTTIINETETTNPDIRYVGNSLEECMRIKFICEAGFEYFSDDKGCGCKKSQEVICDTERQQACTKEYVPVCGKYVLNTGQEKYETFGNGCTACAEMKVVSYVPGSCAEETPEVPQTDGKQQAFDCTEEMKSAEICTLEYAPVCGWFNENIKCFAYPCASTYSNKCMACAAENVDSYSIGECPTPQ